ncbi:unnamed protein product [Sphagnum compactum]
MSEIDCNTVTNRQYPPKAYCMLSLWNLFRLALVCSCMLFAVLVSMVYSLNRASLGVSMRNDRNTISPLQVLLNKDQNMAEDLQETDCGLLRKINEHSTLELKTLVIAETIVPHEDKERLSVYVRQQLEASDVLTELQKDAVLTMVILAPIEASVNKEETGAGGSLRNSAVLALLKHHHDNIHFLLIGVRAEPRLGWKQISSSERNAWNDVLSRVLYNKVRVEAKNYVMHNEVHEIIGQSRQGKVEDVQNDASCSFQEKK